MTTRIFRPFRILPPFPFRRRPLRPWHRPQKSLHHRYPPAAHHCTPPALAAGSCLLWSPFCYVSLASCLVRTWLFSGGQEPNQRERKKDEVLRTKAGREITKRTGSWLQELRNRLLHEDGPDETGKCRCRALGLLILSFCHFVILSHCDVFHSSTFFISSFLRSFGRFISFCFAFSTAPRLHSPRLSGHSFDSAHTNTNDTHTSNFFVRRCAPIIYFVAPTLVSPGLCRVPLTFSFVETKVYCSSRILFRCHHTHDTTPVSTFRILERNSISTGH